MQKGNSFLESVACVINKWLTTAAVNVVFDDGLQAL